MRAFNPKPLGSQIIVVTGASSGIGLATARLAASRGAKVVLAARDGVVLARVQAEIEAGGGAAVAVPTDVGSRAGVAAIVEAAAARFGGFDTWINVAGLTIYGPLTEVTDADSERLLQTNFWGTVYCSLTAVAHLREKGGGLINVGSVASDLAFPMQGMYAASKHAVKGFTDALRMELSQAGDPVTVTLIKPTSINTPLPQRARNYLDREPTLPPPVYQPEVVARAILQAAVEPQRDVYVGGAGRILSDINRIAPVVIDRLAPLVTALQKRREPPRRPAGALHRTEGAGYVRGDARGYKPGSSLYTQASFRPSAALAVVAGLTLAAAFALRQARRS